MSAELDNDDDGLETASKGEDASEWVISAAIIDSTPMGSIPSPTQPVVSNTMAPALIALSDTLASKMSNGLASKGPTSTAFTKWLWHVTHWQVNRRAQHKADVLIHSSTSLQDSNQPPAKPPPLNTTLESVVMGSINPDHDSASVSSKNTFNSNNSNDSLFGMPPLCCGGLVSSSKDDDSTFQHFRLSHAEQIDVEAVTLESSFDKRVSYQSPPQNWFQKIWMILAPHHLAASLTYGILHFLPAVWPILLHHMQKKSVFMLRAIRARSHFLLTCQLKWPMTMTVMSNSTPLSPSGINTHSCCNFVTTCWATRWFCTSVFSNIIYYVLTWRTHWYRWQVQHDKQGK